MTKVEIGGIATTLVVAAVGALVTFAGAGFFSEKSLPLEKRIQSLEISSAEEKVYRVEVVRRLSVIEDLIRRK